MSIRCSPHVALIAVASLAVGSTPARAERITQLAANAGERGPVDAGVSVSGNARLRGDTRYNFDLDRGLTPSGQPLYSIPLSGGQRLQRADFRLRVDLDGHSAGGNMGVRLRIDVLDNIPLGGDPDYDRVVLSQRAPTDRAFVIQRAFGYTVTPLGVFAAGRMNNSWGLGILANGGDCRTCDGANTSDRVAFATPLLGHTWAMTYDFSATGPFTPSRDGRTLIDLDPSTNAHAVVFAVDKSHAPLILQMRRAQDRLSLEYGGYYARGWQADDLGVQRLSTAEPVAPDPKLVQSRGLTAHSFSLWGRMTTRKLRVELESVAVLGRIAQPSLVPGLVIDHAVEINTWGAALEADYGAAEDRWLLGLRAGFASGDRAPGFGAFPRKGAALPRAGDLDGAQVNLTDDFSVDNFRFHPNYRVDRILFREILGTITDAAYLRLQGSYDLVRNSNFRIIAELGVVGSAAMELASTPGSDRLLGVEVDPTLRYEHIDGFALSLDQATLLPLAGLDNVVLGLAAQPAQLWRLRARFAF